MGVKCGENLAGKGLGGRDLALALDPGQGGSCSKRANSCSTALTMVMSE